MIAGAALTLFLLTPARGTTLMQEAFDYPGGSALGTASPWTGSPSASLSVVPGNLGQTNFLGIVPMGNMVQVTGGGGASAYRIFSATPVTSGTVYCSFLIQCSNLPLASVSVASLLQSGVTAPSSSGDPLDLYVQPLGGGYGVAIGTMGSGAVSAGKILGTNETHLVVLKYAFGTSSQASLYIDPTPGGLEPATPDVIISAGGGGGDDDDDDDDHGGGGTSASSVQSILFQSSTAAGEGIWNFDTLRVGTAWADVTPFGVALSLSGPADQAVCSGSPAMFSVMASGMPPYTYAWRTNGIPVPGATNSDYQLASPGAADASNLYDVVVQDGFGSITSRVARLFISTTPPVIAISPVDQLVTPNSTNAVFTVTAAGDAPLAYQWRTNGVAVPDATNDSYTVTNPSSTAPPINYDVVVSNPCGIVTSTPPATVVFPSVFYPAFDAGPGFFSGENLVLTNNGGMNLQVWSSDSLTVQVPKWNPEGPMQEQPMNDGTGRSLYSINVTPATSPAYYIFGGSVASPYLAPIPILVVTTDPTGMYALNSMNAGISASGNLVSANAPTLTAQPVSGGLEFSCAGVPGNTYLLQACTSLFPPAQWVTIQTNVADASGLIGFSETNTAPPSRFYRVVTP